MRQATASFATVQGTGLSSNAILPCLNLRTFFLYSATCRRARTECHEQAFSFWCQHYGPPTDGGEVDDKAYYRGLVLRQGYAVPHAALLENIERRHETNPCQLLVAAESARMCLGSDSRDLSMCLGSDSRDLRMCLGSDSRDLSTEDYGFDERQKREQRVSDAVAPILEQAARRIPGQPYIDEWGGPEWVPEMLAVDICEFAPAWYESLEEVAARLWAKMEDDLVKYQIVPPDDDKSGKDICRELVNAIFPAFTEERALKLLQAQELRHLVDGLYYESIRRYIPLEHDAQEEGLLKEVNFVLFGRNDPEKVVKGHMSVVSGHVGVANFEAYTHLAYGLLKGAVPEENVFVFESCSHTVECDAENVAEVLEELGLESIIKEQLHSFLILALAGFDEGGWNNIRKLDVRLVDRVDGGGDAAEVKKEEEEEEEEVGGLGGTMFDGDDY